MTFGFSLLIEYVGAETSEACIKGPFVYAAADSDAPDVVRTTGFRERNHL